MKMMTQYAVQMLMLVTSEPVSQNKNIALNTQWTNGYSIFSWS